MKLSPKFSGMSIKTAEGERFMLINSNHSLARQNFTICHELYHLYYQKDFSSMICDTEGFSGKDDDIEYIADCFAAALLIPEFGIVDLIPPEEVREDKISLSTLLKIEHYFGCSRTALLFRLIKMGFISSAFYKTYSKDVKKGAVEYGYSTKLYEPTKETLEVIGKYGSLAKEHFDDGKLSENKYVSFMMDIGIDLDALIDDDVAE